MDHQDATGRPGLIIIGPGGSEVTHRISDPSLPVNGASRATHRLTDPPDSPKSPAEDSCPPVLVDEAPGNSSAGNPADRSQASRPGRRGESPADPGGRLARFTENSFYASVLAISVAGAGTGAARHVGWPTSAAIAAAAVFELGGVVLSAHADSRRIRGESALPARALSTLIAAVAVALNFASHAIDSDGRFAESASRLYTACFFAGLSAVGFATWRILRGAGYRDARRAAGEMAHTAPTYGVWQWLRHPRITSGARARALADPSLGLLGSLAAERDAERTEQRRAAISQVLGQVIRQQAGPLYGRIATLVYDPERIADRLIHRADYELLTDLVGRGLTARRLAPADPLDLPDSPDSVGSVTHQPGESPSQRVTAGQVDSGDSPRPAVTRSRATHPSRVIDGECSDSPGAGGSASRSPADSLGDSGDSPGDSPADSLGGSGDSVRRRLTDEQTIEIIYDYVERCWRSGVEPGQRPMLDMVLARGAQGSQRRCKRLGELIIADLQRRESGSGAGHPA